jgi:hypothetical protein
LNHLDQKEPFHNAGNVNATVIPKPIASIAPQCVKYAGTHFTSQCLRKDKSDVTCVLCNGNHPANYKGCTVYKDLQKRTFLPLRRNQEVKHPHALPHPHITPTSSYATAVKSPTIPPQTVDSLPEQEITHRQQPYPPQTDIQELKTMLKGFMEQMGTMINLLTTLVSKLAYMITHLHIVLKKIMTNLMEEINPMSHLLITAVSKTINAI